MISHSRLCRTDVSVINGYGAIGAMRIRKGNRNTGKETYPNCYFVHHKLHMAWPWIEPGPQWFIVVMLRFFVVVIFKITYFRWHNRNTSRVMFKVQYHSPESRSGRRTWSQCREGQHLPGPTQALPGTSIAVEREDGWPHRETPFPVWSNMFHLNGLEVRLRGQWQCFHCNWQLSRVLLFAT